jgi:hypothetical protein
MSCLLTELLDKLHVFTTNTIGLMMFNATFNNISAISFRSVLFVGETGVPGENHRPVASQVKWRIYITCLSRIQLVFFLDGIAIVSKEIYINYTYWIYWPFNIRVKYIALCFNYNNMHQWTLHLHSKKNSTTDATSGADRA